MTGITLVQSAAAAAAFGSHAAVTATLTGVASGDALILAVEYNGVSALPSTCTDTSGNTWHFSTSAASNPPLARDGSSNTVLVAWALSVAAAASVTVSLAWASAQSCSYAGSLSEWSGIAAETAGATGSGSGSSGAVVNAGPLTVPVNGLVVGAASQAFRAIIPNAPLAGFSADSSGTSGWAIPGVTSFTAQWATTNGSANPTTDQSWLAAAAVFSQAGTNTITVANPGAQVSIVGTPVTRAFTATDSAGGQTLTWSASGLPAGLSINSGTGTVSGTPATAGTYSAKVTATDGASSTGFAAFTWTVAAPGAGPYGTVLRAIDGGNGYYSGHGFTQAAAAGMDGPVFFPLGIWDALLSSQSDANRWIDLGINVAWVLNSGSLGLMYPANPIYMMAVGGNPPSIVGSGGYTPGAETIGQLGSDEPAYMTTWEAPIQAQPDASQDSRWWWVNFTGSNIESGVAKSAVDPTLVPLSQVLTTTVLSPGGVSRVIDVASADIYYYTGANDSNLLETGGILYALHRNMTGDEAARGSHYGDTIDMLRTAAPALAGGNGASAIPFLLHVENGGPDTSDTSVSNTTVASGSNTGVIGNIATWSAPSAGVLAVASTTGFDSSGTLFLATSSTLAQITYAAISGNTFTGCAYVSGTPSGTISTGGLVYQSDYITPPQMNQALWATIIHGARGISYFNNTFAGPAQTDDNFANSYFSMVQAGQSVSMYAQAKATNALINQLAPVLYSPVLVNYFTVTPAPVIISPFAPDSGIDAVARCYAGGGMPARGIYIFATTRYSQTAPGISATFTTVDGYSGPVTVINESRTVTAVNGVFTDTFANGLAVHIYQIPLATPGTVTTPRLLGRG